MDETTTPNRQKKRPGPKARGRYNWSSKVMLRMSKAQHQALIEESTAANLSINELCLSRVFGGGHLLAEDHLPVQSG